MLGIAEIGHHIFELLGFRDMIKLMSVSKKMTDCVIAHIEFWNFHQEGEFPVEKFQDILAEKASPDSPDRYIRKDGVRAQLLVIAPGAKNEYRTVQHKRPMAFDMHRCDKFFSAVHQIPMSFRRVAISGMPLFSVDEFEILLNSMPNLETMAITQCLMLDFTKLNAVLEAIDRHPRKSGNKQRYVAVEFEPYYFHGPKSDAHGERLGTFGITYHQPCFDISKAVGCSIIRVLPLAHKVGMDLLSDNSPIFQFMLKLPGPKDTWALEFRDALMANKRRAAANAKNPRAFAKEIICSLAFKKKVVQNLPATMRSRLGDDCLNESFWLDSISCQVCKIEYPRGLFHYPFSTCWGCASERFVNVMEDSHLRLWQRSIMLQRLGGFDPKTAKAGDLATSVVPRRLAFKDARKADELYHFFRCEDASMQSKENPMPVNPIPAGIDSEVQSVARWRLYYAPLQGPVNLREGGPQQQHPCTLPYPRAAEIMDIQGKKAVKLKWPAKKDITREMAGPAIEERRRLKLAQEWEEMTEAEVDDYFNQLMDSPGGITEMRNAWHRQQNVYDREVSRKWNAVVDDQRFSLVNAFRLPYNMDKLRAEYQASSAQFEEVPYRQGAIY
ncbi:hypothetical protein B0T17DRAFT_327459 [Bombardia bombarda]|uniref:F-box domain-containing protein n=1 Tax=Bombardia bombarda TaxID=252184 RepID=A0AA40BYB6_9PEZI|nr:hypothetical protein B0T17DRAFT_327459 [Bombardia bombarda]